MWQFRNYWKIAVLVNTLLPFCIGYVIGGNLQYGVAGFVFIGIGRAIQQQATFCINSLVHFFGSKKYVNGTAGDIPLLFFMFLGENWHNFHHAFPRDYRNGHKWYHLDAHKWIIALMEKLGLASNLVRTPKERIMAKIELTKKQFAQHEKNN
jgi:stearoyl-CoA desaturase (delta-9 desaturase)